MRTEASSWRCSKLWGWSKKRQADRRTRRRPRRRNARATRRTVLDVVGSISASQSRPVVPAPPATGFDTRRNWPRGGGTPERAQLGTTEPTQASRFAPHAGAVGVEQGSNRGRVVSSAKRARLRRSMVSIRAAAAAERPSDAQPGSTGPTCRRLPRVGRRPQTEVAALLPLGLLGKSILAPRGARERARAGRFGCLRAPDAQRSENAARIRTKLLERADPVVRG